MCTTFDKGRKLRMKSTTKCEADTGYQGIAKWHSNSKIPKKKGKNNPLTTADKRQNHRLSSSRVIIENVIREVKIFRIVAEKYRNRTKRFGLRFNLMAAIYNLNINANQAFKCTSVV